MQKELLDNSDKQDHHQCEDLKTPRDFEGQVDKINGFL
jgi:hypothetical protein